MRGNANALVQMHRGCFETGETHTEGSIQKLAWARKDTGKASAAPHPQLRLSLNSKTSSHSHAALHEH